MTLRYTLFLFLVSLALIVLNASTTMAQYKVIHLEKPFNTPASETGAIMVGDTIFAFSSTQPTPKKGNKNKGNARGERIMQVYQARVSKNGKIARPRPCRWGINSKRQHTGNICLDPTTNDLYFTRSDVETLRGEIYFARKLRRGWEKPIRLSGGVNLKDYSSTQPTIGRTDDGNVILYFSSNRPGGFGGFDIWYTIVKDGVASECTNLGPMVNSPADEITPFYDQQNGVLYLSSDRPGGHGGHDIYAAVGSRNSWQATESVCGCLNSEQNDIYFTITQHDANTGIPVGGYLSSNRPESYYLTDSTCCNDLFRWGIDSALMAQPIETDTIENTEEIVEKVRHFMFPLFLYFHNDDPDPMSRKTATSTSYTQCWQNYTSRREEYIARQTTASDSSQMALFFDTCVNGNYRRIEELFDYVENLLDNGHRITITVAGYASPVFHSDYNKTLSQRRIGSFVNMVKEWRSGIFDNAMTDGRLIVVQRPYGAVTNTDSTTENSHTNDPVYSITAAQARRIEILSCEVNTQ